MQNPNPLAAYDRQRHLAWFEEQYPDLPNWPPYPRTNAEAAVCIAQYAGCEACGPETPPVDLAALMDALELAARAAFMADQGTNPEHVRDDLLQATTAAAAAFGGSEAFRALCIVLGTIAGAVTS